MPQTRLPAYHTGRRSRDFRRSLPQHSNCFSASYSFILAFMSYAKHNRPEATLRCFRSELYIVFFVVARMQLLRLPTRKLLLFGFISYSTTNALRNLFASKPIFFHHGLLMQQQSISVDRRYRMVNSRFYCIILG